MAAAAVALVLSPPGEAGARRGPGHDPDASTGIATGPQRQLMLASDGVERHVWESRYGAILIEVQGGEVFVNGQHVQRADA